MDRQQFHNALTKIWEVVGEANRYIDHAAPWTLKKTDPARMATVLYVLAETIRRLALLTQPVMPDATAKMLDQLAVAAAARQFASLEDRLQPGTPLPKPEGVFPRFVEEEASA
jgi:methionyl-tRNA synthetase